MNEHSVVRRMFEAALGTHDRSQDTYRPGGHSGWYVPADDVPHTRTWMSWPSRRSVWGRQLGAVQDDIALIARTVGRYEPVIMCAPDSGTAAEARAACGSDVTVIDEIPTDDLWMRDICAVFRGDDRGHLEAVGLNFNGWGNKQKHRYDAGVAEYVAEWNEIPFHRADFVGEGGSVETDGDGTVMATESSLVNKNRNRGMRREEIEELVLKVYGADRMIWVPGVRGKDITDNHIDVTSRFIRPGVVMVQLPPADRNDVWARDAREQMAILSAATDARGRRLAVIPLEGPDDVRSGKRDFVDSYMNFHVVNGAVITAQFGDRTVDRLMAGGGGIHCSTMQEPRP